MPLGNRTGPLGTGPMTGRVLGYGAGFSTPGFMNPAGGLGFGRGFGRGFVPYSPFIAGGQQMGDPVSQMMMGVMNSPMAPHNVLAQLSLGGQEAVLARPATYSIRDHGFEVKMGQVNPVFSNNDLTVGMDIRSVNTGRTSPSQSSYVGCLVYVYPAYDVTLEQEMWYWNGGNTLKKMEGAITHLKGSPMILTVGIDPQNRVIVTDKITQTSPTGQKPSVVTPPTRPVRPTRRARPARRIRSRGFVLSRGSTPIY